MVLQEIIVGSNEWDLENDMLRGVMRLVNIRYRFV